MKTEDFMNEVTVESLNKELKSKFGQTVDVSKYSKEQLETYSKNIGAKLEAFETKNKFNDTLESNEYQKALLIKKLVETAINQYIESPMEDADDLGEDLVDVDESDEDVARDFAEANADDNIDDDPSAGTDVKPNQGPKTDSKTLTALRLAMADPKNAQLARMAIEKIMAGRPLNKQQIDAFKDAMQSMMAPFLTTQGVQRLKAVKKALPQTGNSLAAGSYESAEKTGTVIKEGEEDKAAVIMAAKDMVDRFTAFLEDVAEMSAEGLLELSDSIRDEMGQEQAESFTNAVAPALEQTIEQLKSAREAITGGVGVLTGEGAPADTIGSEPAVDEPMPGDDDIAPVDEPADDEFSASEPATGGEEPLGREKRESVEQRRAKLEESTRIFSTLSK